jgi:hypothetical protein
MYYRHLFARTALLVGLLATVSTPAAAQSIEAGAAGTMRLVHIVNGPKRLYMVVDCADATYIEIATAGPGMPDPGLRWAPLDLTDRATAQFFERLCGKRV